MNLIDTFDFKLQNKKIFCDYENYNYFIYVALKIDLDSNPIKYSISITPDMWEKIQLVKGEMTGL